MPSFLQKRSIAALVVVFCLLVAAMAALAALFDRQTREAAAIEHTLLVEGHLSRVLSLLQDAETGQRGYLLTGNLAYLEPFNSATAELDKVIESLGRDIADNAAQVQALGTLRLIVNDKLEELVVTIELKNADQPGKALAAVASNKGKVLMDRAREVLARMLAEEQRLLALRESAAQQTYRWVVGGIAAAILITIALGWLTLLDARHQFAVARKAENKARAAHQTTLDEIERRERLESQLRQSQKMEAVGQLTGGIAHDFNNMLAVVIASLNLLKRRLRRGETDNARFIDGALDGAERAATLTHRLLAFSRQQPLAPQPIDSNKLVAGMSEMLRRTLGDHISVETVLAGGLWRTHADPGQLENAIVNLAVNSRDAMPDGGKLTIETANASLDEAYAARHIEVRPGQYVMLAVSETGQGMPADIVAKAFEPFFTTKAIGEGTGLGLASAYGVVKHHGGFFVVESEEGRGSTFRVFLPAASAPAARVPDERPATAPGGKSVLLIDDEEHVLRAAERALARMGYRVTATRSGAEALEWSRGAPSPPDLVMLDMIMPGMSGRATFTALRAVWPEVKVLLTSGYSAEGTAQEILDAGCSGFLQKPYDRRALVAKLKELLG
jgi:signal transduction histidine kinase